MNVPEQGQFRAAIRVTTKCCDACVQGALRIATSVGTERSQIAQIAPKW